MGRKPKVKSPQSCRICGSEASGINFNVPSCMACKAFFRRHALRPEADQVRCQFGDQCQVTSLTRRFCASCRLKACLSAGMRKDWILTEHERTFPQRQRIRRRIQLEELEQNNSVEPLIKSNDILLQSIRLCELEDPQDVKSTKSGGGSEVETEQKVKHNDDGIDLDSIVLHDIPLEGEDNILVDLNFWNKLSNDESNPSGWSLEQQEISLPVLQPHPPLSVFPLRTLLESEVQVLNELREACSLLTNPYMAIREYPTDGATVSQYFFRRAMVTCSRLNGFRSLNTPDQRVRMRTTLMPLLGLRSVLLYQADQQAWGMIDDDQQVSVRVRTEMLRPHCAVAAYERHLALPGRFRAEWKSDPVIFDLLTALMIFTPSEDGSQQERFDPESIKVLLQEYQRYSRLLVRYLGLKYSNESEADQAYDCLLGNLAEIRLLNRDVWGLCSKGFSTSLTNSPPLLAIGPL